MFSVVYLRISKSSNNELELTSNVKMAAHASENKFSISWHDSAWIPILNSENVLEYFCQRSNTFYDKTCNNEHVKMQRLDPAQLQ